MLTIGLTGNFGMGKTTVLKMFGRMGAQTYDIDCFVHSILEKPDIIKKIVNVLGSGVLSIRRNKSSLNKKRIADVIFNDADKRKAVEKIIHPEVLKLIKKTRSRVSGKNPAAVVVFEVPLLFEAGYEKDFDKIVVVCSSRKRALTRLAEKGFTEERALGRMSVQIPISKKMKRCDYTINNNFGLQRTEKRVKKILDEIMNPEGNGRGARGERKP